MTPTESGATATAAGATTDTDAAVPTDTGLDALTDTGRTPPRTPAGRRRGARHPLGARPALHAPRRLPAHRDGARPALPRHPPLGRRRAGRGGTADRRRAALSDLLHALVSRPPAPRRTRATPPCAAGCSTCGGRSSTTGCPPTPRPPSNW
ncbi:hypothetical protein ACR6C2_02445 [Streptomyces sp. INA 01156]